MIDLNTAPTQAVRAFAQLSEPGNDALLRFLSSELEDTKQKLVHADDTVHIHRLQGRAEALEDLLRAAEESLTVVSRRNAGK